MILKNLKKNIEKNRKSKNILWLFLIITKDILWAISDQTARILIKIRDKQGNKRIAINPVNEYSASGIALWGYMFFRLGLNEATGKIKIPAGITNIKIDVGLSHNAPNSALWLNTLKDRVVFGFDPNPESVRKLVTNKYRAKYIGERFFVFQVAIDSDAPGIKTFYMTEEDPGTSSLYKPSYFKIKKIIQVPYIRLSDFLSLVPWEKIPYIEHLKVDTQGNDLRVVQSAGKYLSERIVFVTAECSTDNQYEYSHTERELDDFMKNAGFTLIENSIKSNDKTYINSKFKNLMTILDYSTQ